MNLTIKTILLAGVIAIMLPTVLQADEVSAPIERRLSPVEYVAKYATLYGVDESLLQDVMQCESKGDPKAVGDHGKAKNVFQFHESTFKAYSSQYFDKFGIKLNYDSYKDQIQLASWMFSIKQQNQWTCYKIVKAA